MVDVNSWHRTVIISCLKFRRVVVVELVWIVSWLLSVVVLLASAFHAFLFFWGFKSVVVWGLLVGDGFLAKETSTLYSVHWVGGQA